MDANPIITLQFRYGAQGTIAHTEPNINDLSSATTPIQIKVAPAPTCTVVPASQAICAGGSATFTVSAGAGTVSPTFSWSGPNGHSATGTTITINNATAADAGTYVATVTDAFGCTSTCSGALVVNPNPVVAVNSAAVWAGHSATLTASVSGITAAVTTYAWTVPGGVSNPGNVASFSASVAGQYCVTVTDANGCTGSGCGNLTVNPNPIVAVNSPSVCAGSSATLTASVSGITAAVTTYAWTVPAGASNPGNVA